MKDNFKVGDIVNSSYSIHPFYVVAVKKEYLKILFDDGSCGWHDIVDHHSWKHSNSTIWTPEYLKERIEIGFKGGWIDNLTYVELLNQIKEYDETSK